MPLIDPKPFVGMRPPPAATGEPSRDHAFFLAGQGAVAQILRSRDWQETALNTLLDAPLGSPWRWPQALRTVVRLLLNTQHPMLVFWGASHACLYNDAFATYLGPERHPSALGRPAQEVWAEIWHLIGPQLELVMTGGGATWQENQLVPIGRADRLLETYWTYSFAPIDDRTAPNGIGGVLAVCVDTTTQVLAARAESRAAAVTVVERDRLARMFAQAPGFMALLVGPDHRIELANDAFLRLAGPNPVIGRPIGEALAQALQQDTLRRLDLVLQTGVAFTAKSVRHALPAHALPAHVPPAHVPPAHVPPAHVPPARIPPAGPDTPAAALFLDVVYQPFRDAHGAVTGIFVQGFDSTDRTLAEAALRQLNETLEQRVATEIAERSRTEDALRQAQKMEAVGQLTGGLAHDFNNVLQGIVSSIDLAERRLAAGRPDDAQQFLENAQDAASRAGGLTTRLLAFARGQALDPRPVMLEEVVQGMLALIRHTVGDDVQIELRLRDDCWPVLVDANQLESVLLNLAINARDAIRAASGQAAPGRMLIETAHTTLGEADIAGWTGARPGTYVRLTVKDTGSGMPPEVMAHAFEPFFTTKPEGQGTGLGLSQLYGFVRQSQGVARLESAVGAGTSVHLFLPRCHDQPDETVRQGEVAAACGDLATIPAQEAPTGDGAIVLLVDDETEFRLSATEGLRDAGFRVLEAADASEALRTLSEMGAIDVLVTDIGLSYGLNGRQLAAAARELIPELPVLLISGYMGDAISGPARLRDGMSVLAKPFKLDVLARRIAKMAGRTQPAEPRPD